MAISTDPETEPNPEPVEEPETAPETALDSGELDIEAEVLFQVAHYKEEYGSPASMADIAFEIQEQDSELHDAIMDAVKEGTPKVKPVLKSLIDQGLIVETEYGGYIATEEGEKMVKEPETQAGLGSTYESEKHKGNPSDETSEEYDLSSEDGKDKKEKYMGMKTSEDCGNECCPELSCLCEDCWGCTAHVLSFDKGESGVPFLNEA